MKGIEERKGKRRVKLDDGYRRRRRRGRGLSEREGRNGREWRGKMGIREECEGKTEMRTGEGKGREVNERRGIWREGGREGGRSCMEEEKSKANKQGRD